MTKNLIDHVTIAIPTHQRAKLLSRTLESLSHLTIPPDCQVELLVIANACTDDTERVFRENAPKLPFKTRFMHDHISGLSRARNKAIQETSGDLLVFLDDDVWVDRDLLVNLLADMDATEADVVMGKVELDWQEVAKPIWFSSVIGGLLSQVELGENLLQLSEPMGAGCNMAIRTSLFGAIGTFNECIGRSGAGLLNGEDTDFLQRALDTGANVVYSPRVSLKHWVAPHRLHLRYLCHVAFGAGYVEMFSMPHLSLFWTLDKLTVKSGRAVFRTLRAAFSLCCGNTAASRKYFIGAATAAGEVSGLIKRIFAGSVQPPMTATNSACAGEFQQANVAGDKHRPANNLDRSRLHIGLVCNAYPPKQHGGIGTATSILAEGFAGKGHKVTVFEFGTSDRVRFQNDVRVITLRQSSAGDHPGLRDRWKLCKKISALAQNGELDVVECPDYLGLIPFKIHGCQVVIRLRNTETIIRRHAGLRTHHLRHWAERRTLSLHRTWVALSEHILNLTQAAFELSPERHAIIPNALNVAIDENSPAAEYPGRYILYLGRVSGPKGALLLAQAARPLMEEFSDLTLVYMGEVYTESGRRMDEQIRGILGESLSKRCRFTGYRKRSQALRWLQQASVLAVASGMEAHPNVVAEAMLLGVPVVASNIAPFTEFLKDGYSGLLVDPQDTVAFTTALRRILLDPELAARLACAAKAVAEEQFCPEKILNRLYLFYRECIGSSVAIKQEPFPTDADVQPSGK
ncbi:MAG TPA: glycosyltransferase [Phycisphaerae bacterium]|nr:glycosyltransferase [Phycisphaerae bacterium]